MRKRLIVAVIAVIVLGAGIYLGTRGGDPDADADDAVSGLETRDVSAGEVDVTVEPLQLDQQGAAFTIVLDTHAVDLSADLTRATLEVGGTPWPVEAWSGDGPGGHHREGELRFESAGPATGTAILTIPELPEPVEATWDLDG